MFMRKTLISDDYIILIVNIQSNYQITKKDFRMKLYFIYQQKEKLNLEIFLLYIKYSYDVCPLHQCKLCIINN